MTDFVLPNMIVQGEIVYLACWSTIEYSEKNDSWHFSGSWSVQPFRHYKTAVEYLTKMKKDDEWKAVTVRGHRGIYRFNHGDATFLFIDAKALS